MPRWVGSVMCYKMPPAGVRNGQGDVGLEIYHSAAVIKTDCSFNAKAIAFYNLHQDHPVSAGWIGHEVSHFFLIDHDEVDDDDDGGYDE